MSETPRTDACFRTVQERLRYMAQVAKTTVMRNSLSAGADRIEQLERENAALREALRTLTATVRAYFNPAYHDRHYFNDKGKLLAATDKAEEALLEKP